MSFDDFSALFSAFALGLAAFVAIVTLVIPFARGLFDGRR